MLHEDELYSLIKTKQWSRAIDIIGKNKSEISSDLLLKQAFKVFESEFFNDVNNYSLGNGDQRACLETLYQHHERKYCELNADSYKKTILELIKLNPLHIAYNYAKLLPQETECAKLIRKFELTKQTEDILEKNGLINNPIKWTEIYNMVFPLINNPKNSATYFPGTTFVSLVREYEPNFPNYYQYKIIREKDNLSFSRKDYFFEILINRSDDVKYSIIKRILDILKPYESARVKNIERLLGISEKEKEKENNKLKKINPKVFISYSWDNEEHRQWVRNLADELCYAGVNVILDQYDLSPGKNMNYFIEKNISKALKVIVIFTPNYKLKADKRKGGVGFEYSMLNVELYENQIKNKRLIPILRKGTIKTSIPTFMKQFIHINMIDDNDYNDKLEELLREIYQSPKLEKPLLGKQPVFK